MVCLSNLQVDQGYAHVEKEFLAVMFSMEKFYQYRYSMLAKFLYKVTTSHKKTVRKTKCAQTTLKNDVAYSEV